MGESNMADKRIILNHSNYVVLKGLVDSLKRAGKMKQPHFARFAREMKDAIVMDSQTIPDDVITMYSRVVYTYIDSGKSSEAVIAFPAQASQSYSHVSILSPLGLALIGEREGTEVEYVAPGGTYKLKIEEVEHLHSAVSPQQR